MENIMIMNESGKRGKLLALIFISSIAFLAALVLLFLFMRLFFGLLSFLPWMTYVYSVVILAVPAVLFITVYSIYFKRTLQYPVISVKILSCIIFSVILLAWAAAFISDAITFMKKGSEQIEFYYSWNMPFLASSVAILFIIGVIQALALKKEEDWLDKYKDHI